MKCPNCHGPVGEHGYHETPEETPKEEAEREVISAVLAWRKAIRSGRVNATTGRIAIAADALAAERAKEPA